MKKTLLTLLLAGSAAIAMAAEAPVFQFKMDEGEGDTLKNTGSAEVAAKITGTNYRWVEGRQGGKALYLGNPVKGQRKNNACAEVRTSKKIDFMQPFTVTVWVKPDKDLSKSAQYTIVGNATGDRGPGWRLSYGWGSFRLITGLGKKADHLSVNKAKFPHEKDVWHHVAITWDGKVGAIYLNGLKAAEKECPFAPGAGVLTIGAYMRGFAHGFRGAISDLAIYDKALSAEDILMEAQGIK